jgi:uncharacterized protein YcnI
MNIAGSTRSCISIEGCPFRPGIEVGLEPAWRYGFAPMKIPVILALCLALASCLTAFGHVTVAPAKSPGAFTGTFTLRVPSEGGRTTTGLVLTVPKGVTVLSVAVPQDGGSVAYQRKTDGQPDEVVWTLEIKPGVVVQLALTATIATDESRIVWKVTQKYADGTKGDWTPATVIEETAPAPAPPATK